MDSVTIWGKNFPDMENSKRQKIRSGNMFGHIQEITQRPVWAGVEHAKNSTETGGVLQPSTFHQIYLLSL